VFAESDRYRNADNKKKEREDPIRRRQAVPFGVVEWPIDGRRAGIID
jgi:hypothetical protein